MTDPIKIEGLNEFRRNLKALDSSLPKALRLAFNKAADLVVQDAKPGIPTKSGKAKGSVKARSSQTKTRVVGGGNKAPYFPWLDFGGKVGRNRSVSRPFLREGRYLYESYYKNRDSGKIQKVLEEALLDVARQAGVEVSS